ncbi:hypothetical protein RLB20_01955, partial [Streptococcus pneumoniae]|nr:hypothetical protein [Streptococcus pneumoniae]MDS3404540.1 hypothetical protein [Streptococcus pneumoniae]MDS3447077.1 hypothetical protein [Streptococcus pneumoniae]MDS5162258.1 hypothetical protein [Streptococcus pneumoniae]MDS5601976.1 hypothetical protein [Streptococcus pneumoniae]
LSSKKHPLGEKRNHPGSKLRQGFWMIFRLGVNNWGLNKEMSAIRIEIEHFNAKFKTFQIMSVPYRNRRKRFELRAELICAIINYEVN